MKKNMIKGSIVGFGLAAILTTGGLMAYFTDSDTQTNTFTVGKVTVDLQEPEWDKYPDTDKDGVPDEAEDMTPNKTIKKDPTITNTGINDQFVFATVQVPCRNIIAVNPDGTRKPAAMTDLYSYTTNPGWVKMGTYEVRDGSGVTAHRYLYAFAENNTCTALEANRSTNPIFSQVTSVNAVEGQGLENERFEIPIQVYAIQTSDLNGGKTSPADVWKVYTNQNSITEQFN